MKAYSIIFALAILLGCNNPKSHSEQRIIQREVDKLYHCFNMSDSPERVKSCQKTSPELDSDSLILFRNQFYFENIPYKVQAYYSFDEFGLFEIQLDFYADGFDYLDSIYHQLNFELTNDFGEPNKLSDYLRWTTSGESNSRIEISLSKDLDQNDSLFVSLNYLEPLNEEI